MFIKNPRLYTGPYIFKVLTRYYSGNSECIEIWKECFGFTSSNAERYLKTNRLQMKTSEHLLDVIKCCRNLGYKDQDILDSPNVFRVSSMVIEQRYLIMEEGGFQVITPNTIADYRYFYGKPISELKEKKLIPQSANVAKNFVNYLKPRPDDFQAPAIDDGYRWCMVQRAVVSAYLKWRLNTTDEQVERLFRIHKMINNKCMRFLCENIQLALDLGLSTQKIIKCGYILHSYPKYAKEVLATLNNIAGLDLRAAMKIYPKLMMVSPKKIITIYGILKEFGISDEAIQQQRDVFLLAPSTLRLRLEEIQRVPEFQILMSNPRILTLVKHHGKAKNRLTYLQKLQFRCADRLVLATAGDETFNTHVRIGKDVNFLKDVLIYLSQLLKKDKSEFKERWIRHPFHNHVPLLDMQETYDCLTKLEFTDYAIYRVIHILLYPKDKVTAALESIESYDSAKNNRLSQVQRLNLALYHIEKDHHFTGNGIWRDNRIVPELSETKYPE